MEGDVFGDPTRTYVFVRVCDVRARVTGVQRCAGAVPVSC